MPTRLCPAGRKARELPLVAKNLGVGGGGRGGVRPADRAAAWVGRGFNHSPDG